MAKKIETDREKKTSVDVVIGGIDVSEFKITVIGTSDYISHKFSNRAIEKMEHKQQKKASKTPGRETRDPQRDYMESLYILKDGRYGIPISAFKNAAVDACSFMDGQKKTIARGAFHIIDEYGEGLAILNGTPKMRKDMVTVGMGSSDIRYRGSFPAGWKTTLKIRYNKNALSIAQIIQLFNTAGFSIGVGDWRPQTNGSYGMFEVVTNGR